MNASELRLKARESLAGNYWPAVLAAFVAVIFGALVSSGKTLVSATFGSPKINRSIISFTSYPAYSFMVCFIIQAKIIFSARSFLHAASYWAFCRLYETPSVRIIWKTQQTMPCILFLLSYSTFNNLDNSRKRDTDNLISDDTALSDMDASCIRNSMK